jgi:hypothetical protein
MSESDWTEFDDSVASPTIRRSPTTGITAPVGGEDHTYVWNTTSSGFTGAHGLFYNAINFAPMAKGGEVMGALVRLASGGPQDFAVFLVIGGQGNSVNDDAYLLGLQDSNPPRIVLRKGAPSGGLPDDDGSDPSNAPNILRRSTESVAVGEWVHLRLEMVANEGGGDTILRCWRNDLDANDVDNPVWEAIDGMDDFVDDAVGINSGSVPLSSGYVGFGFFANNVTRRAAVDHVQANRQQ